MVTKYVFNPCPSFILTSFVDGWRMGTVELETNPSPTGASSPFPRFWSESISQPQLHAFVFVHYGMVSTRYPEDVLLE